MTTNMIKLAIVCLLGAGCYTTRIVSGVPAQNVAPMAQGAWHHSVVMGIAEISPPVDLVGLCPQGSWAVINEEMSFLNGLVGGLTGGVYTPRTYTVTCGAGAAPATAALLP